MLCQNSWNLTLNSMSLISNGSLDLLISAYWSFRQQLQSNSEQISTHKRLRVALLVVLTHWLFLQLSLIIEFFLGVTLELGSVSGPYPRCFFQEIWILQYLTLGCEFVEQFAHSLVRGIQPHASCDYNYSDYQELWLGINNCSITFFSIMSSSSWACSLFNVWINSRVNPISSSILVNLLRSSLISMATINNCYSLKFCNHTFWSPFKRLDLRLQKLLPWL